MNWQQLSTESHYQTAVAVENELHSGNYAEAATGIKELIEALSRSDRRALKSQLIRLLTHIIKWKSQPEKRSRSWVASIYSAREEILDIQTEIPSLNQTVIEEIWERCFQIAQREAAAEMNQAAQVSSLTWAEVFADDYQL
jgi:hypothetical protein